MDIFLAMADEKSRIGRLEARSREAEIALQQLRAYVELLRNKKAVSSPGEFSEELKCLEEENAALKAEASRLKQQLVTMEIRNGVPQIPIPSQSPKVQVTTPTSTSEPPVPLATDPVPAPVAKETQKATKKPKEQKKAAPTADAKVVDVSRLDFRIGCIVKAWKHPDADALYVEEVDVGEEKTRTVCSGLTKFVPLEQMQNVTAMFLCNLKPAKMRGVMSEAMIMCASTPEKVEILVPPPGCVPGDRVYCEGYRGDPDPQLNPKKKIFETIQPELRVSDVGVACYKNVPFEVEGHEGVFNAPTLKGVGIK